MSDDYQVLNLFGQECDVGWGYDARIRRFINKDEKSERCDQLSSPYLIAGEDLSSSTFDFHSESENSYSQMMNKLFGNCRDFIEAIVNRNENAYNLIEFLMEKHKNIGLISLVTMGGRRGWEDDVENHDFPEATHFVARVSFGMRMLIIFNATDTDLLGNGDKTDILDKIWKTEQDLTENQKKIVCQVLIFSQKTTTIREFTMEKILQMISEPESSIPLFCEMTNLPGKIRNSYFENFEQYEILTDQIFEIYWVKKFLENEIRSQFMNQLSKTSKKSKWSEYFDKEELMSNLEKIANAWNQKMKQSSDLLEGKDVSMYDLWSTFPMEDILELKNYA
uniref:Uncharacterized protein n=1 Tax=Panagrolaimus sp. JU765 TaxID=591449 RepID=A0AC34RHY4_9BILA